jgi:hypothetical protein
VEVEVEEEKEEAGRYSAAGMRMRLRRVEGVGGEGLIALYGKSSL